ncbi:MAG TPA: acyl-CoA dehydrogenase family protein, partial [Myxococcota bacterium]|nr:acyl-CoA dehydrogenase family protein [Myxococcota bacterium]
MDAQSVEENRVFAEKFDRVCQERIAARAHEVDREGALPTGIIRDLSEAGYFKLFHPKSLGGVEADTAMLCAAMESLGKACPSTYWVATVSSLLVGKILHKMGNAEQHQRFLLPIIRAERIGAFAAVETGPGGDQSSYQTTISKSGNNFVLNGFKSRVNNAPVADTCVIVARNLPGEGEPGDRHLRFVFVDLRQKGVKRFHIPTLGMRGSPWGGMFLDNVVVTPGDILAGDFETVLDVAEWGQVFVSFMAIGVAESALDAALEFTGSRANFGQPAGHMQAVHRMIATIRMDINAARALAVRAVWAKMHKQPA